MKKNPRAPSKLFPGVAGLVVLGLLAGCTPVESVASPTEKSAPIPLVVSMTSDTGPLSGGQEVTITGDHLGDVVAVKFADETALFTVVDSKTIVVTVPADADFTSGTVPVIIETGSGAVASKTPLAYSYASHTAIDREMEYLFTHWDNYNTAGYGDYNPSGGDCMNFVSQSLLMRGWEMTDDWYNNGGDDASSAWVHVPTFDDWLRVHPEYGATELSLDQRDLVKVGDMAVFDWDNEGSLDHIQVVSAITVVDGVMKIAMVGHNKDSEYRDLDQVITVDHPGATGYFWSIPAA